MALTAAGFHKMQIKLSSCVEVHNCIGVTCLNIYVYHLKKKLQCCDLEILNSVLP